MAKLPIPLSKSIILGFKGTLDFYQWKGINVVRRWPRKPTLPMPPGQAETAAFFAAVSSQYKELAPEFNIGASQMVVSSQQRPMDFYIGAQYGTNITYSDAIPTPPEAPEVYSAKVMQTAVYGTQTNIPVNSAAYVSNSNVGIRPPYDLFTPTKYRIVFAGQSTQAGQTISLALFDGSALANIMSGLSADLVITNTNQLWDSGFLDIVHQPSSPFDLRIGLKGSNATVDLNTSGIEVQFV